MKQETDSKLIKQVEIEAKLRIPPYRTINLLLQMEDLHDLLISETLDVKDLYFDSANMSMEGKDKLLRIRVSVGSCSIKTELSWKGPRLDKDIDTREDVSLIFQNNLEKEFVQLFELMGYKPYLVITKHRRESSIGEFNFELDQNLHVLDLRSSVEKDLGDFISVCYNIPIKYSKSELREGRIKVMKKVSELSNIGQLESRSFIDLFHLE